MKKLLLCILLFTGFQMAHAQYYKTDTTTRPPQQPKSFDPSKLVIGGSLGLVFGDYTNVDVSPLVGYRFNNYIAAGVNINAQYGNIKYRDFYGNTTSRDQYTIFGGGVWGRVYPIPMLFVHVQPEYNSVSQKTTYYYDGNGNPKTTTYTTNYAVPSLLLGAGYTQAVGGRVGVSFAIMYDVLQDGRSPYQNNLIYRAGVGLGF
ncbi:hypothetical protein ACE38W_07505 [Chitinophaga sp. Hz27]|uniref:hypothetical protein n=1 Tax=Chitinophaga sp. Hz27 TaxID=3347169 RepID=UPI0035D82196